MPNSLVMFSNGPIYMDAPDLADQQELFLWQLSVDPGYCLEKLLRPMENRNGWRERVK